MISNQSMAGRSRRTSMTCGLRKPTPTPRSGIAGRSRKPLGPLKDDAGPRLRATRRLPYRSQYFGAGAAPPAPLQEALPPAAPLQEDFPLLAGAAAPPLPLHELLPPAAGSVAPAP